MRNTEISRKRVLVVEDEPGIAAICARTLTGEGYQVDVAVNGKVALDMWVKAKYDICLSDIRTPEMNGIELYEKVKKEYPDAADKFIFTTGDVLSSNIKEFLDKADRPYLPKPFTPDELRAIVKSVSKI